MAAAGIAALGTREAGSELLVRYTYALEDGNREWHARMVLAEVGVVQPDHWWFVILTPDSDVYAEDFGPGSADIMQTRDRPLDRSIPYGVDQAHVYDFAVLPTPEQLTGLFAEGQQEAARERVRLGAVVNRLHGPVNVQPPAPPRVQLPIQGGGAALQPAADDRAPPGGLLPPVPNAPQVVPQGGLAALAASLGAAAGPVAADPFLSTASSRAHDVRVLPVRYVVAGQRYREFAEVVPLIEDICWPDTPVNGPSTFRWVCRFIKEHGGTPTGWHTKCMGGRLQAPGDGRWSRSSRSFAQADRVAPLLRPVPRWRPRDR